MDFSPEETHLALAGMAGDFARQEILPASEETDLQKDPADRFPSKLLEKGSRLGLRTLAVPEALGGGGADLLALCFVGEELGWADLGVGATFAQDWALTRALEKICGKAPYAEFAQRFTEDHSAHLARADLSPTPSPEERAPYEEAEETPLPSAGREGADWSLSGFAAHVMNGAAARWLLLSFGTSENGERNAFLVEAAGGAWSVRHHDPMGMRSSQDVALTFQNIRVSESCRIPCSPAAWAEAAPGFFILPASAALGTARHAHEHATAHARERVQGGRPIIEHQTVGFMLGENLMELGAARRALQAAAWGADRGGAPDLKEIYLTKVFVSEACERIARRSMEVWGGAGYMTEAPMERFVRDMTSFMHSGEMMHSLKARVMTML